MLWLIAAFAYLVVGGMIIALTRARTAIANALEVADPLVPAWKIVVLSGLVFCGALLFWPLFLRSWFAAPTTAWDALQQNPLFRECRKLHKDTEARCNEGVDTGDIDETGK